MNILINIWYIFSFIIGGCLAIASCLLAIISGMLILMGLPESLINKEYDETLWMSIFIGISAIVITITLLINNNVSKHHEVISEEIYNIVSYQGIANVKEGKYNNDYLYFTQGTDNNYTVLKLEPRKCVLHYTNDNQIKVIENHIEYLSSCRYFAVILLNDDKWYDVYLPEKYNK